MYNDTKHDNLINRLIFNNSKNNTDNIDINSIKNNKKYNYKSITENKILNNFIKIPLDSNNYKRFLLNLSTNEPTELSIHLLIISKNTPKYKILYNNRPIDDSISEDLDIKSNLNSNINNSINNYEKKSAFGIYRNKNKSKTLFDIENKVFYLKKNQILSLDRNIPNNTKFIYIFSNQKNIFYNLICIQYNNNFDRNIIESENKKSIQKKLIFNKITNDINSIIN